MAVLGRELPFLAILAPRTGCTAMSVHLVREGLGRWCPRRDLVTDDGHRVPRKHSRLADLLRAGLVDEEQRAGLTVFTTVRNPYDSLVSLWSKYVGAYVPLLDDPDSFVHRDPRTVADIEFCRDHSFSDWIVRRFESQVGGPPRHLNAGFLEGADRVLRFESLQDDLDALFTDLGHGPVRPVPRLNPTENRVEDHRALYDDRAQEIVRSVFAADLERFGYSF